MPLFVQQKVSISPGLWAFNLLVQRVQLNTEVKQLSLYDSTNGPFNLGRFKWVPLSQFHSVGDDSMQCSTFVWSGMGSGCQEACKVQLPNACHHPWSESTAPVAKQSEDNS